MGDMADFSIDCNTDDESLYEYSFHTKVCRLCGMGGLVWSQDDNDKWRLFEYNEYHNKIGEMHKCPVIDITKESKNTLNMQKAIDKVWNILMDMNEEEFKKKLSEHENGKYIEIFEEIFKDSK